MRLIFFVLLSVNVMFFGYELIFDKTAAEPKVVAGVRQFGNLQTLAEQEKSAKTQVERRKLIETESGTPISSRNCQLVGPFAELVHAENLIEHLKAIEVASEIKHIDIVDGKTYLVYSLPEISDKEAFRRLNELQAKGIDSYIIPEGELTNGISFGQFGDENEAKTKLDSLKNIGYLVELKEIPKKHVETWVEIQTASAQKINADQWVQLMNEEKGLERRENYCLGVAN